ncbi:phosphatase PAP2 family protein [Pseudoblastomonas halimionae]|uniref:Phosphatase PAP2 family protein n=1 Tax=Alteriqipengyuania halimionae TaxID=1926630 RepID=A0A6I4TZT5_9SPHN|nr:phosphatase PAP2 family protein [Alteriqipengyuania halimionae]MXP09250.1 phosphatase PAP2 family protein [Alteriqipengyuania halimionae]
MEVKQNAQGQSAETDAPPSTTADTIRLPERGFAIDRPKALIAAAMCWAGWAIMVWLVTTGRTLDIDQWVLLSFRTGEDLGLHGSERVLETVRDITALGGVFLRNLFALAAVVALLFLKLRREAVLYALTVASGWVANTGMKLLVGRERPEIVPHLTHAGGESFPSGHSFSAAVVYIGMAIAFAALSRRHSVRYTVIGFAMAVSALVAFSRVLLGVHFPSDVIAGWLGGAGWAFLAAALFYAPAKAAAESETVKKMDPSE